MRGNQCDGCLAGVPVVEGLHWVPYPSGPMSCQASRYTLTTLTEELRTLVEGDRSFLAIKLDRPSRKALMKWWVEETKLPLLPNVHVNHVTLKFEPEAADLEAVTLGSKVAVEVVGWAEDERAQAVRVTLPVKSASPIPHVTVATAKGTPPSYSKELLARGVTSVQGPTLHGSIEHMKRE